MPSRPEKENIVILGASGHVGRLVSAALEKLCPYDIRVWRQFRNTDQATAPRDIHWDFACDDAALIRLSDRIGKIHALVNFAGVTADSNAPSFDDNARLAIASLKRAAECNVSRVFLASSAAVYGGSGEGRGHPFGENDALRPVSPYGAAKRKMERAVADFVRTTGNNGPRATCLRIANVAGADKLLRNAANATGSAPLMLERFDDGQSPVRSYIGPETLARVVLSLLRGSVGGADLPDILNVSSPEPVAMTALCKALVAQGKSVPIEFVPASNSTLREVVLSTEALQKRHRFLPEDSQPSEMICQWLELREQA